MAASPKAATTTYLGRPAFIELTYVHHSERVRSLVREIEEALSQGTPVVVRGWKPSVDLGFSVDDIHLYRPTTCQEVTVQGRSILLFEIGVS